MSDRWQGLAETKRKTDTLVVNLFGGPGVGKSTVAALAFGLLKENGISSEFVQEYAKQLVWHDRTNVLEDQLYILGKQAHYVRRLLGQVDVIITDGPILLSKIYASEEPEIVSLCQRLHDSWNTWNIFLERNPRLPFVTEGRTQGSLMEAQLLDKKLRDMLTASTPLECWGGSKSSFELAKAISDEVRFRLR